MSFETMQLFLLVIARILVGALFLYAAIHNALHWRDIKGVLLQKKFVCAGILLFIAIAFELVAALLIIIGIYVKVCALLLIPFTLISIMVFHDFWNKPAGEIRALNFVIFLSHMTSTLAALIFLVATS